MAGNDELFRAFSMFSKGVNQLQASMAIGDANDRVREIRNNVDDETERRKQLDDVALGLRGSLAGFSVPSTTIESLSLGITGTKDKPFSTSVDVITRGTPEQIEKLRVFLDEASERKAKAPSAGSQRAQIAREGLELRKKKFGFAKEQVEVGKTVKGFGKATTKPSASKFRELLGVTNGSLKDLDKLIELAKNPKAKGDPVLRRRAKTLAGALQGKLRLAVIGPGAVSDQERAFLEEIIANPTKIFELPSQSLSSLFTLQESLSDNVLEKGLAFGIDKKFLDKKFLPFKKRANEFFEKARLFQIDFSGDIGDQVQEQEESLLEPASTPSLSEDSNLKDFLRD